MQYMGLRDKIKPYVSIKAMVRDESEHYLRLWSNYTIRIGSFAAIGAGVGSISDNTGLGAIIGAFAGAAYASIQISASTYKYTLEVLSSLQA